MSEITWVVVEDDNGAQLMIRITEIVFVRVGGNLKDFARDDGLLPGWAKVSTIHGGIIMTQHGKELVEALLTIAAVNNETDKRPVLLTDAEMALYQGVLSVAGREAAETWIVDTLGDAYYVRPDGTIGRRP